MIFFGTDGIRGKAYESLPLLRSYQLGYAINKIFKNFKVIVGYDTRESSLDFLNSLLIGLGNSKHEIAGVVTTPVISYYSKVHNCVGIMITASHNPYYDNGLKVFFKGKKISDITKNDIEKIMIQKDSYIDKKISFKISEVIQNEYLNYIHKHNFNHSFENYAIDAANGAASFISEKIFKGEILYNKPNGRNINKDCGCTNIQNQSELKINKRVIFFLDGDSDRMLMSIDNRKYSGEEIIYIIIKDMLLNNKKPIIALTIMTNPGFLVKLKELNIDFFETDVGDQNLMKSIITDNADIGFEPSGHFLIKYKESIYLGDGILSSLKIIDIISRLGLKKVKSWIKEINMMPMKTESVAEDRKKLATNKIKRCIKKILDKKKENDKIIIRPSGTEDLIRITVAMEEEKNIVKTINEIKTCIIGEDI